MQRHYLFKRLNATTHNDAYLAIKEHWRKLLSSRS